MKSIQKNITPKRAPTFITKEAHDILPELCELVAEEKSVTSVKHIDVISLAIEDYYTKMLRRQARRATRAGATQAA